MSRSSFARDFLDRGPRPAPSAARRKALPNSPTSRRAPPCRSQPSNKQPDLHTSTKLVIFGCAPGCLSQRPPPAKRNDLQPPAASKHADKIAHKKVCSR
eukprot:8167917-Pyramimonas_sp.AAC.1